MSGYPWDFCQECGGDHQTKRHTQPHSACGLIHDPDEECTAPHGHNADGCPDDGLDCHPRSDPATETLA